MFSLLVDEVFDALQFVEASCSTLRRPLCSAETAVFFAGISRRVLAASVVPKEYLEATEDGAPCDSDGLWYSSLSEGEVVDLHLRVAQLIGLRYRLPFAPPAASSNPPDIFAAAAPALRLNFFLQARFPEIRRDADRGVETLGCWVHSHSDTSFSNAVARLPPPKRILDLNSQIR
jgi:hypothetical protein